MTDSCSK